MLNSGHVSWPVHEKRRAASIAYPAHGQTLSCAGFFHPVSIRNVTAKDMDPTVGDNLEQLERKRADLKCKLDRFEAGEVDPTLTDAQRQSASQYMRRALSEFNTLISAMSKRSRPQSESIHLF
jgi:hypothetical protein